MWNLVGYFSCVLLEYSIWGCIHIYLGRLSERRRPSFWGAGERERAVPFQKSVWLCFPVLFKVISPALELLHSGWCEFPFFPSFPQHWGVLHCWTYRLFEIDPSLPTFSRRGSCSPLAGKSWRPYDNLYVSTLNEKALRKCQRENSVLNPGQPLLHSH